MSSTSSTESVGFSSQLIAAFWMLASAVMFTAYVALGKFLSSDYGPAMLGFYRSIIALVCVIPFILQAKRADFDVKRPGLLLLRSLCGTFAFILALFAISEDYGIPVAQYSAISFSRSLFIVILAAVILKEDVGPRRWIATLIGFIGILVMVKPSAEGGNLIGSAFAITSALSFAVAIILVKVLTKEHTTLALLIFANFLSTVFSLPIALFDWDLPTNPIDAMLILALGVTGVLAQAFYILGMQKGDASFLSTIDYVRLPLTSAMDWLIFRTPTGPLVWVGAVIIIASTTYITIREARLKRSKTSAPETLPP